MILYYFYLNRFDFGKSNEIKRNEKMKANIRELRRKKIIKEIN